MAVLLLKSLQPSITPFSSIHFVNQESSRAVSDLILMKDYVLHFIIHYGTQGQPQYNTRLKGATIMIINYLFIKFYPFL